MKHSRALSKTENTIYAIQQYMINEKRKQQIGKLRCLDDSTERKGAKNRNE